MLQFRPAAIALLAIALIFSSCARTEEGNREAIQAGLEKFEKVCLAAIKSGRTDGMEPVRAAQDDGLWITKAMLRRDIVLNAARTEWVISNSKHFMNIQMSDKLRGQGRQSCGLVAVNFPLEDLKVAMLGRLDSLGIEMPLSKRHRDADPEFPDVPYFLSIERDENALLSAVGLFVVWN